MYQAYARMCEILTRISFFYSHLHAILGAFYKRFLVYVNLSGIVVHSDIVYANILRNFYLSQQNQPFQNKRISILKFTRQPGGQSDIV